MKIKRSMIHNLMISVKSLTNNADLNQQLMDELRSSKHPSYYQNNLNSESPREARFFAMKLNALTIEGDLEKIGSFCEMYGFQQIEEDTLGLSFVNTATLTTYHSQNKVIKVTHFQGDGFFKSPPNSYNKGKRELESSAKFYLNLYLSYLKEPNPIKARLFGYSMNQLEQLYEVYLLESENYYFIIFQKNFYVFDKELESIGSERVGSFRTTLDKWLETFRTVNRTSISIFVLATFILSNSIMQFNIVAPYIEFKEYVYQIGDEFRVTNVVERIHDDNDPFRAVSDAAPFKPIQDAIQRFNRNSTTIGLIDQRQLILDRPGSFTMDITISDALYTRMQTVEIRVVNP
jgi:hypothetical protein